MITTNEERALPDAFIRRCLVLYLGLPDGTDNLVSFLVERGRAHFSSADPRVLEAAAGQLARDRKQAEDEHRLPLPGQAEYLDLLRAVLTLVPDKTDEQLAALEKIGRYTLQKHIGVG